MSSKGDEKYCILSNGKETIQNDLTATFAAAEWFAAGYVRYSVKSDS